MTQAEATVTLFGSAEISALLDGILNVYQETFSQFPYNYSPRAAASREPIIRYEHKQRNGFMGAVARDGFGRIIGFLYGYTSASGQWWHDEIRPRLEAIGQDSWLEECFEIVDFAVLPAWQGQGLGGQLHDNLLAAVPHKRALLSTIQLETAAWHFYQKRDWQLLAQDVIYTNGTRKSRILGLDLAK